MTRTAIIAAFAAFLAVSPMALAAEPAQPPAEAAGTTANGPAIQGSLEPNQVLAANLEGAAVYNDANKQIGTVKDIVVDRTGRVVAVVLNNNNRNVAVDMQALKIQKNENGNGIQKVLLNASEAQLQGAPTVDLNGNTK